MRVSIDRSARSMRISHAAIRNRNAGNYVDEKDPPPIDCVGDESAHRRTECQQHRNDAEDCRMSARSFPRTEHGRAAGETRERVIDSMFKAAEHTDNVKSPPTSNNQRVDNACARNAANGHYELSHR
jgi:hypothetical protein